MTTNVRLAVALETSARPASIAVMGPGGARVARTLDGERSHASDLLVVLASATEELGGDRRDLDLIVVGTGPGSYTGLRVGAATALGLHRGSGAALVGVPSFEAIARAGLRAGEQGTIVRNAFGGQVYVGTYVRTEDTVEAVGDPACGAPAEVCGALGHGAILMADDDALRVLGAAADELDADLRTDVTAQADDLLTLGLARFESHGAGGVDSIQPLYLRPFEAKVRRR